MKPLRRSACKHFVLLTGPTNSGKTWRALEQLKAAPSGVYAAPLRLLAYEGFRKLNESGVPTSLVTGQQRIVVPNAKHVACTVEMIPTAQKVDVCVLDEMQLIGDPSRGFAWTRAILQNQATRMYLCGQANAVPLVTRLVSQERGAVVEVEHFERFNKLQVQDTAVGKVSNGDCIVCFSRKELYRIKRALEETGKTVNIVYGALPPEARVLQAEEFNKGDSVLVATDAVGLGLNLQIKRVVFSTVWKFDGTERRRLTPCEVKQIAGRSGRGVKDEFGFVTALEEADRAYIADCFATQAPEVLKAGFLPSLEDLLLLAGGDVEDNASLALLYRDYMEQHRMLPELDDYFLCELDDIVAAADVCDEEAPSLDMSTRYMYSIAPVDLEDELCARYFALFLRQHAQSGLVKLMVKIHRTGDEIDADRPALRGEERDAVSQRIGRLESLYSVVDCYVWLATRFGEDVYTELSLAIQTRQNCADEIARCIALLGWQPADVRRKKRKDAKKSSRLRQ